MSTRLPIPCNICKHYKGQTRCNAFPSGIPDEIYFLGYDHRKEYPGDNGIRFEPRVSCSLCENYIGNNKCLAFKRGIPEIIYTGQFEHTKEFPGDKGYRFKLSRKVKLSVFKRTNNLYKFVQTLTPEEKEAFLKESKEMYFV